MIYLITVNYEAADLIRELLASVRSQLETAALLVIVNNSPNDAGVRGLAGDGVQILEAGENLGFGGGCNLGLAWVYARDPGAIAWLINPDARLEVGALRHAIAFCQTYAHLAIVGTLIREGDGSIWFAGGTFNPQDGTILAATTLPDSTAAYLDTDWVTGCSLILNLANFAECPQFDRRYFLYYEDFDFCRRYGQQGQAIALAPQIQVIHQPSSITGREPSRKYRISTTSYLLALETHTAPQVLLYRLGRIVGHALKISLVEPQTAIAIIKGVFDYLVRVRRFVPTPHR